MKKKQCSYCGKTYTPKSNHSKYCSKKCKNKRDNETRMIKYHKNEDYRKRTLELKSERWRERYRNEPGFKEKHIQQTLKQRKNNPQTYKKHLETCRKSFKNRYRNNKEFRDNWKQRMKKIYQQNKNKILKRNREYGKTENGKLAYKKNKARRKRNLKFIPLWINPFPDDITVDYHHINNLLTIPIPKKTHLFIPGVTKKQHLKHNQKWIQKIYCFDFTILQ